MWTVSRSSSKDSSPTLASKVDQLEGMLKMLREDLKKVGVFSSSRPLYVMLLSGARGGCLGVPTGPIVQEGLHGLPLWKPQASAAPSELPPLSVGQKPRPTCHCGHASLPRDLHLVLFLEWL